MFANAKEKQQFIIPYYLPGLSHVHISSDNLSQNSCIQKGEGYNLGAEPPHI